jgi:hypothetical protein
MKWGAAIVVLGIYIRPVINQEMDMFGGFMDIEGGTRCKY